MLQYAIVIDKVSDEDGGGYIAFCPDLPGCMSDGETREEALANVTDAMASWFEVQEERGVEIPAPGSAIEDQSEAFANIAKECEELREELAKARARISQLENRPTVWQRSFGSKALSPSPRVKHAHA